MRSPPEREPAFWKEDETRGLPSFEALSLEPHRSVRRTLVAEIGIPPELCKCSWLPLERRFGPRVRVLNEGLVVRNVGESRRDDVEEGTEDVTLVAEESTVMFARIG